MIKKVKDLSKVTLNKEDVLIEAMVKVKKSSGLDLSAMDDKSKKEYTEKTQEVLDMTILAKGENVVFNVGQHVVLKQGVRFNYEVLDSVAAGIESLEKRIATIHMNNIEFAINTDNYEL